MKNLAPPESLADLKPEFDDPNGIWLTNGYTLRTLIGVLGMALPVLLWLYVSADSGYSKPLESVSHYYYTRAGTIFTIILSLLAIFLIVYKGRERIDFYLSLTAGVFALFVLLFPTSNLCTTDSQPNQVYCVTILRDTGFTGSRVLFHYISAGVFLSSLAIMSLFVFTKSDKPAEVRSRKKVIRNRIYRLCGVVMIAAILVIFFGDFLQCIPPDVYKENHITFWMESAAVEAFGLSWLVKGEMLIGSLKDVQPGKRNGRRGEGKRK
jgi:hypothetical protein